MGLIRNDLVNNPLFFLHMGNTELDFGAKAD